MNYKLDAQSHEPAYLQLYRQIKNNIVKGIYAVDSKIPSKRIMAAETGVSTITVEHAYALLCEEGYIEPRERSGFFVIFRADGGFAATPEGVVALTRDSGFAAAPDGRVAATRDRGIASAPESKKSDKATLHAPSVAHAKPEFPFSVLAKTMRRVMSDYADSILLKSPNSGCVELREALRLYLARNRGINVAIEQIVVGSGAEYLYTLIGGILGKDQIFALEAPSYEKIEQVYRDIGITYEFLPLGADGIESAALAATKARVLHLSPYQSFPTGITASASKRYEYIRWAAQPGHFIVEDDFASEFTISTKPDETLFALSEDDNVIYLNTFSQTISPALRMGYMVLPVKLVKPFFAKLGFYSCTVPTFEQLVLANLLAEGDFERHINRVRRAERRKNIRR